MAAATETVKTGTVKWFSDAKGYGFIAPDKKGDEVLFVHQSSILSQNFRTLSIGEKVEFKIDVENGRKKAIAVTGPQGAPLKGKAKSSSGVFKGDCNYCHVAGHMVRDCPEKTKPGNSAKDVECFKCKEMGHFARECPSGGACYACNQQGHMARDCPNQEDGYSYDNNNNNNNGYSYEDDNGYGGDDYNYNCYSCGKPGHYARECTAAKKG